MRDVGSGSGYETDRAETCGWRETPVFRTSWKRPCTRSSMHNCDEDPVLDSVSSWSGRRESHLVHEEGPYAKAIIHPSSASLGPGAPCSVALDGELGRSRPGRSHLGVRRKLDGHDAVNLGGWFPRLESWHGRIQRIERRIPARQQCRSRQSWR